MDRYKEANLDTKTTADFIAERLRGPVDGEAYFRGYLRTGFLESAVNTLYQVRRQAGLTQAQVAEKLNTKQAAIARLEDDTEGAMSLRRYVDFVMACGMIPYDITYVPIEAVRSYTLENPQLPLTQERYHNWLLKIDTQSMLASPNENVPPQPEIATTVQSSAPTPKTEEFYKKTELILIGEKYRSNGVAA